LVSDDRISPTLYKVPNSRLIFAIGEPFVLDVENINIHKNSYSGARTFIHFDAKAWKILLPSCKMKLTLTIWGETAAIRFLRTANLSVHAFSYFTGWLKDCLRLHVKG